MGHRMSAKSVRLSATISGQGNSIIVSMLYVCWKDGVSRAATPFLVTFHGTYICHTRMFMKTFPSLDVTGIMLSTLATSLLISEMTRLWLVRNSLYVGQIGRSQAADQI